MERPEEQTRVTPPPGKPAVAELPSSIGPFRVCALLGEGGMGTVYLAEQEHPVRRLVAVKVIKLGMDTREVIARFANERQALALMNHTHIAKVLDAGSTAEGRPYFVMEHVPGVPLHEHCDRQRLDLAARLRLFVDVCHGVQHAHEQGVIHRDLKPSNVLVQVQAGRPVAKIIDFGTAKAIEQRLTERTVFTEEGRILGTPEYMSPEQASMDGARIDERTDIWGLGVMLYELLTGVLPFDPQALRESGYFGLQRCIREQEPPRPSTRLRGLGADGHAVATARDTDLVTLRRRLRGDLEWVVMRALEKDPARRYASAAELAAEIERFLAHQPVRAGPPGVLYRLRKLARRRRSALLGGAAVLAAAACGVAVTLWVLDPGRGDAFRVVGAKPYPSESDGFGTADSPIRVYLNTPITLFFSHDLDPRGIAAAVKLLRVGSDGEVAARFARVQVRPRQVLLDPRWPTSPALDDGSFQPGALYRVEVAPGALRTAGGEALGGGFTCFYRAVPGDFRDPGPLLPVGLPSEPFFVTACLWQPETDSVLLQFSLPVDPTTVAVDSFAVASVRGPIPVVRAELLADPPRDALAVEARAGRDLPNCAVVLHTRLDGGSAPRPGDEFLVTLEPRGVRDVRGRPAALAVARGVVMPGG